MKMQLDLIQYGRFSYNDVDTMPLYELYIFYDELKSRKKESNGLEALEEGI